MRALLAVLLKPRITSDRVGDAPRTVSFAPLEPVLAVTADRVYGWVEVTGHETIHAETRSGWLPPLGKKDRQGSEPMHGS